MKNYYNSQLIINKILTGEGLGSYRWHTRFTIPDDHGNKINEIEYLIRNSKINNESIILDWGCGMGWLVVYLAKKYNCRVEGINISKKQLFYANKLAVEEKVTHLTRFYLYDGKKLPFPNNRFDIVYSQEALVHAPDKQLAFGEIFRVLKPGGELSIQDWFANEENENWPALTRDIDIKFNTFLDSFQNTVRLCESLGFIDIATVDMHKKLGSEFLRPFGGFPFFNAISKNAFTVVFLSAQKPRINGK